MSNIAKAILGFECTMEEESKHLQGMATIELASRRIKAEHATAKRRDLLLAKAQKAK